MIFLVSGEQKSCSCRWADRLWRLQSDCPRSRKLAAYGFLSLRGQARLANFSQQRRRQLGWVPGQPVEPPRHCSRLGAATEYHSAALGQALEDIALWHFFGAILAPASGRTALDRKGEPGSQESLSVSIVGVLGKRRFESPAHLHLEGCFDEAANLGR